MDLIKPFQINSDVNTLATNFYKKLNIGNYNHTDRNEEELTC
jgi:hypothetical protein